MRVFEAMAHCDDDEQPIDIGLGVFSTVGRAEEAIAAYRKGARETFIDHYAIYECAIDPPSDWIDVLVKTIPVS